MGGNKIPLLVAARSTLNPLGSLLVRYFEVAAISVPPA